MPDPSARAQLEIPSKPALPSTISPVPLKQERDVSPEAGQIRILVVGDPGVRDGGWHGDSDEARQAVAARAREACTEKRCDLVLILGDNLYDKGIRKEKRNEDSEALAGIVEGFLADADTPVYLVMGNHDWSPRIPRHSTVDRQLEWIGETSEPDVRGNAHYFNFQAGPVEIWALDTSPLVRKSSANRDPKLLSWLDGIGTSTAAWKIVAAHHPMRSNGEHGNPGRYRDGYHLVHRMDVHYRLCRADLVAGSLGTDNLALLPWHCSQVADTTLIYYPSQFSSRILFPSL